MIRCLFTFLILQSEVEFSELVDAYMLSLLGGFIEHVYQRQYRFNGLRVF